MFHLILLHSMKSRPHEVAPSTSKNCMSEKKAKAKPAKEKIQSSSTYEQDDFNDAELGKPNQRNTDTTCRNDGKAGTHNRNVGNAKAVTGKVNNRKIEFGTSSRTTGQSYSMKQTGGPKSYFSIVKTSMMPNELQSPNESTPLVVIPLKQGILQLLISRPKINFMLWRTKSDTEMPIPNECKSNLMGIIFAAVLFSRTILLVLAEQNTLSQGSIGRIVLVMIPFFISIQQLVFQHDIMVSHCDLLHFIHSSIRIGILFCLGWNAPSAFVSSLANLTTVILTLILARVIHGVVNIVYAAYERERGIALQILIGTAFQILPVIFWILAVSQSLYPNLFLYFKYGVGLDCVGILLHEITDQLFTWRRRSLFLDESDNQKNDIARTKIELKNTWTAKYNGYWTIFTFVLIASALLNLFPIRQNEAYPALFLTTPFSFFQFLFGGISVSFLISLCTLLENGQSWVFILNCGPNEDKFQDFARKRNLSIIFGRLVMWIHLPLTLCIVISLASLQMTLLNIYPTQSSIYTISSLVPYNMSLPIGLSATQVLMRQSTNNSIAIGSDYLQLAKTFLQRASNDPTLGSSRIDSGGWSSAAVFLCSSGLILCIISILDIFLLGQSSFDLLKPVLWNRTFRRDGAGHRISRFFIGVLLACGAAIPVVAYDFYNIVVVAVVAALYAFFSIWSVVETIAI